MDHRSRARSLVELFSGAPLGTHLGMALRFDADLRAVVDLPHGVHLDHALGQVHGGVLATLVDTAAWFTAAVHYDSWITTVSLDLRFLEPTGGEDLVAAGSLIRAGRSLAAADAEVRTSGGRLVAVGGGTFSVTGVAYGD
jgi:uncharacterized protein (TIGR00369 family)